MGPWLACTNELDGARTRVRCWVNDELRQDAPTEDLIFDIPTLISTISAGITLYPGDIIATGTPAGVGIGFDPPKFLRRGDRVRIQIEGIGTLSNPVQLPRQQAHCPLSPGKPNRHQCFRRRNRVLQGEQRARQGRARSAAANQSPPPYPGRHERPGDDGGVSATFVAIGGEVTPTGDTNRSRPTNSPRCSPTISRYRKPIDYGLLPPCMPARPRPLLRVSCWTAFLRPPTS